MQIVVTSIVLQHCFTPAVHVEGELIVCVRLHFQKLGLSRPFSLKRRTLIFILFHVKAVIVVAFKANNPAHLKPFLRRNFCDYEKQTLHSRVNWRNSSSTCLLLIFNTSFTKIKSSKIERSTEFNCTIIV